MGHPNLRKLLVEHCSADRNGRSRRRETIDPRPAAQPARPPHGNHLSGSAERGDLPAAPRFPSRPLVDHPVFHLSCFSCRARARFEVASGGTCRSCRSSRRIAADHWSPRCCAAGFAGPGHGGNAGRFSPNMKHGQIIRFALALVLELIFFAVLNLFDDWTLESMPIKFVASAFLSGVAYLAAVSNFPLKDGFVAANKIDISLRKQAILFWGVAIILRLVALPLAPGDDLFRYQWEGKIQNAGFNPYLIAPADPQLDQLRHDFPEAAKINHPELRAVDPPGAELVFKFLSSITEWPLFYKILFAIADLLVTALLLRLIGGRDLYRGAAWYAWNPLVAYSFAGAAHFDSVMILAMVGGILALVRSTTQTESEAKWSWAVLAALLFGIAISLNLVAASLLLLCAVALRWRAIALALTALIPVDR